MGFPPALREGTAVSRVASFVDGQNLCSVTPELSHAESDKSVGDSRAESQCWLASHRDVDSVRRELCRMEALPPPLSHLKAKLPVGRQSWLLKVSCGWSRPCSFAHLANTTCQKNSIPETGAQPHTAQSQTLANSLTRLFRRVCLTWKHPLAGKRRTIPLVTRATLFLQRNAKIPEVATLREHTPPGKRKRREFLQ